MLNQNFLTRFKQIITCVDFALIICPTRLKAAGNPMRTLAHALCLAALIACGCKAKSNIDEVPETPPPEQGPTLSANASLRPYYQFGKRTTPAGTAFVIRDKAGQLYILTAAHVMDNDAEWRQVQAASLHKMGGSEVAKVRDRPVFVGKSFEVSGPPSDLVVWPLAKDAKVTPLPLATTDPRKNEWVWIVGQEAGSSGPQKVYRCKVVGTESGGIMLEQHDKFELRGFSGGPVVNAKGEVVGSVIGGNAPIIISSAVSSIRQRLKEAKVEVE